MKPPRSLRPRGPGWDGKQELCPVGGKGFIHSRLRAGIACDGSCNCDDGARSGHAGGSRRSGWSPGAGRSGGAHCAVHAGSARRSCWSHDTILAVSACGPCGASLSGISHGPGGAGSAGWPHVTLGSNGTGWACDTAGSLAPSGPHWSHRSLGAHGAPRSGGAAIAAVAAASASAGPAAPCAIAAGLAVTCPGVPWPVECSGIQLVFPEAVVKIHSIWIIIIHNNRSLLLVYGFAGEPFGIQMCRFFRPGKRVEHGL